MNVLVIPEDFRKDQYMLKPIIEVMLTSLERRARVTVCQNPLLGGIDQALNWDRIASISDQYKYRTDLFLLCVERDPKERYFLPFAEQRGLLDEPGQGRKTLAEEAAGQYTTRIRRLCPEVADLENRIL